VQHVDHGVDLALRDVGRRKRDGFGHWMYHGRPARVLVTPRHTGGTPVIRSAASAILNPLARPIISLSTPRPSLHE
jgi:hypothetical protein